MERCDRCPQRATSRVHVRADASLYMCNHHYAKHVDAIEHAGYIVEVLGADVYV